MSMWTRIRNGLKPNVITGLGGATEGDLDGLANDIISTTGGVVDLAGGHALVTQSTSPGMSVKIANGIIYIPNSAFDQYDTDQIKSWKTVLSGQSDKAIGANSSGSSRIDLICAKMDTTVTPDEFASNIATIVVVAGTPSAGVPATPSNHYKLCEVTVANGATSIVNANITDRRAQITLNSAMMVFSGSGLAKLTSGVVSTVVAPTGAVMGTTDTQTVTNKRRTRRVVTTTQSATPTVNTDNTDVVAITGLAQAITSMTTNLSGTPVAGDLLEYQITDNGTARAITWGSSFQATATVPLPSTTVISTLLRALFEWNATASKWDCIATA